MKLSQWAKKQGIHYKTAWRLWKTKQLPVSAKQLSTGTILVEDEPTPEKRGVALYARVSSADQRNDLDRQLARLVEFAAKEDLKVSKVIQEIGSGLNGRRPKLLSLLKDRQLSGIVVEHKDRLVRFGSEYLEALLESSGRRLMVMEKTEMKDDLVQDMIDVLTSFCARFYGRRSAKNRARKALREITGEGSKGIQV
jgi:predicted site-specific integrase-resolvase